jgi:hypothetical protein
MKAVKINKKIKVSIRYEKDREILHMYCNAKKVFIITLEAIIQMRDRRKARLIGTI